MEAGEVGKLVIFIELDADTQKLIKESVKMRELAYSPYSNFQVGAAIQTESGAIFKGCNIECASYGAAICAERTAIANAVSAGYKSFKRIAVCADIKGKICSPCGICRQFIFEFCKSGDISVYLTNSSLDKILETSIRKLLPLAFVDF